MRLRLLLNTISLLLVYNVNYIAAKGHINFTTIGEVSSKYDTLITPAGYTFSIWGFIYLLLACFVGYQWYLFKKGRDNELPHQIGIWFIIANLANISWIFAWVYECIGISVIIMLILLYSLIQLIKNLNMEKWDAPAPTIFFVWWPICIYFGWIILATIVNVSAFYESIGWDGGFISPSAWTILLIIIATGIYSLLIYKRNLREAATIGVWGLTGISIRQWNDYPGIAITALVAALLLLGYVMYHGYKNRATGPLRKLLKK